MVALGSRFITPTLTFNFVETEQERQTAREEVDLENLSVALLNVVDDTMQPESVSVWLREVADR